VLKVKLNISGTKIKKDWFDDYVLNFVSYEFIRDNKLRELFGVIKVY